MGLLLLVRHGQASFGTADYDALSPLGHEQAGLLARRLGHLAPEARVVCGAMTRQRETADVIAGALGATVATDPRWDEYDHEGIVVAHLHASTGERQAEPPASSRAFQAILDDALRAWTAPGGPTLLGESWPDFVLRTQGAFDDAAPASGTVVVVSSAGAIAAVCASLIGLDPTGWISLNRVMVNSSITKVAVGRSGRSLVTFNDHAHLEGRADLLSYR